MKRPKAYSNKEPFNLEQLKEEVNLFYFNHLLNFFKFFIFLGQNLPGNIQPTETRDKHTGY